MNAFLHYGHELHSILKYLVWKGPMVLQSTCRQDSVYIPELGGNKSVKKKIMFIMCL
jgi:hypothetical protein